MQLYPYLTFDGRCEEAFKFYAECLGGKITFMMTYENMPMSLQTPPEWRKKISHLTFTVNGFMLSGVDALPGKYEKPQGFVLQFNLSDPAEAERIFKALAEKGTVQAPLEKTFWAERFGQLIDRFGIPWVINCENQA